MEDKAWTKKAGQKIIDQLDQHFKNNIVQVRYWIIVNYSRRKRAIPSFLIFVARIILHDPFRSERLVIVPLMSF